MKGKNIILLGLMGSGKSTVCAKISKKYKLNFLDFDDFIEREQEMSVADIFSQYGEKYFRELESELILKISNFENYVISTGGGIVENFENIEKLRKTGILFYLEATPETLYSRIKDDNTRPLLFCDNPLLKMQELYEKRCKKYALADFKIDVNEKTPEEIAKEIYEKFKN